MSFLNKIKSAVGGKKKPEEVVKKPEKKESKPKQKTGDVRGPEPIKPPSRKKDLKEIYKVLIEPHISEKATYLSDQNKYIFKVFRTANKIQIKNSVENLYGVRVREVSVINEKSKTRKMRNIIGYKPGYKKAIVALERGHKIEILPH